MLAYQAALGNSLMLFKSDERLNLALVQAHGKELMKDSLVLAICPRFVMCPIAFPPEIVSRAHRIRVLLSR